MLETYITKIKVNKSRNVENFEIPLSDTTRNHLIITGKNGSGKTSLLLEMVTFLNQVINGNYQHYEAFKKSHENLSNKFSLHQNAGTSKIQIERKLDNRQMWLEKFGGSEIFFSDAEQVLSKSGNGTFLIAFFEAKRQSTLKAPKGITKLNLKKKYNLSERVNSEFIQYIVNLKADRSFARDDGDSKAVAKIDQWFKNFEHRLKNLFDSQNLSLQFERKTYNFQIVDNQNTPFNFNTLADGYSAIITIVTELLLRMEAQEVKAYDMEGIVLIDEIETHLHVDLQKRVLPFLIDFFPRIQFIVTTHSPFVLSSVSNSTICDLESRIVTTDLSSYSYDTLIESYFSSDKYSDELKERISEYHNLSIKKDLSTSEKEKFIDLKQYFSSAPKYLGKELVAKIQQIELLQLEVKGED